MFRCFLSGLLVALAGAGPAAAQEAKLTLSGVFLDAGPPIKLLMLLLVLSTIAAVVVAVRKLAAGPQLVGGSAFLSALRLGGPLIGLLGAAFNGVMIFLGLSNSSAPVPMSAIAPGIAEAMTLATLGLLAGAVGVAANWAVESRIDRAVLRP